MSKYDFMPVAQNLHANRGPIVQFLNMVKGPNGDKESDFHWP